MSFRGVFFLFFLSVMCPGLLVGPISGVLSARAEEAGTLITLDTDRRTTMPARCDNAHFLADREELARGFSLNRWTQKLHSDLPVHICGTVTRVFPSRRSRAGLHGYFLMSVGEGGPIRIVSNLEEMNAPAWPWVQPGDSVEVQGRYYYDSPRYQGIDWTHHGTARYWPWPGFVTVRGQKYQ